MGISTVVTEGVRMIPLPARGTNAAAAMSFTNGEGLTRPARVALESVVGVNGATGWVAAPDRVVTAAHVVTDTSHPYIKLNSGETLRGTVLSSDYASDIAVIRIDDGPLPAGLSMNDVIEDETIGVATRFFDWSRWPEHAGREPLMLASVRGVARQVADDTGKHGALYFAGSRGPGSSGGPIIDAAGSVIGMTRAGDRSRTYTIAVPTTAIAEALQGVAGLRNASA